MIAAISGFFRFYASLSVQICCIWFAVWGVRTRSEVDEPMDGSARIVRWSVVALGLTLGYFPPGSELKWLRVSGGALGMVFLCWPNFAVALARRFHRNSEPGSTDISV